MALSSDGDIGTDEHKANPVSTSTAIAVPPDGFPLAQLLAHGAEARIFLLPPHTFLHHPHPLILKHRLSKAYRHPALDAQLLHSRSASEVRCMVKARRAGVDCPVVFVVNTNDAHLIMEYISGQTVRQTLARLAPPTSDSVASNMTDAHQHEHVDVALCRSIGSAMGFAIATLHGANVIHGDLTSSNMIIRDNNHTTPYSQTSVFAPAPPTSSSPSSIAHIGSLTLIDFGLSSASHLVEDRAVDLYVLEKALIATTPWCTIVFDTLIGTYGTTLVGAGKVISRLDVVRQRGRKRSMVG